MRYNKHMPAKNEDGLVSLLVVGIMIILLSLTTVAFTKLMGREAQQALDRVLSTQAHYAAESGINDARDYLNTHPEALVAGGVSDCKAFAQKGYPPYLGPGDSVASDVDKVTCVVADTAPEQLPFKIENGDSRIFEMGSTTNFGGVLFSWDNDNGSGAGSYKPANSRGFLPAAGAGTTWSNGSNIVAPVLEVTYYALPDGDTDLVSQLNLGRTIFLYPSTRPGGGPLAPTYNGTFDGQIVNNTCQGSTNLTGTFAGASAVNHCNAIVDTSGSNSKHIFVKVSAIYGPANLIVRAVNTSGNIIAIQNAQAILDATGKGGTDVLKRLQTIIDYRPNNVEPGNVIETVAGLCKRLEYNLSVGGVQLDPSVVSPPNDASNMACHTADLNS